MPREPKPVIDVDIQDLRDHQLEYISGRRTMYFSAIIRADTRQFGVYNKFGSWMIYETGEIGTPLVYQPEEIALGHPHQDLHPDFAARMQKLVKKEYSDYFARPAKTADDDDEYDDEYDDDDDI